MAFKIIILAIIIEMIIASIYRKRIHSYRIKSIGVFDAYLPVDELKNHAKQLAGYQSEVNRLDSYGVIKKILEDDFSVITATYKHFSQMCEIDAKMPPSIEWLLDNYYILESQYAGINDAMSKKIYKTLPVISEGIYKGYPRIFACATELVAHTDARIDNEVIELFFDAYQSVAPLTSVEVWQLAIMLRLVLIEAIAHICKKAMESDKDYKNARQFCDELFKNKNNDEHIEAVLKSCFFAQKSINESFVENLLTILKKQDKTMAKVFPVIDSFLSDYSLDSEKIILSGYRNQTVNQIRMGNSIISLNSISAINWVEMFERLSELERILNMDNSGVYHSMDTESKAFYRQTIEKISKNYKRNELQIAKFALDLSRDGTDERTTHIGYYIIDDGRQDLLKKLACGSKILIFANKHKSILYTGLISALTVLLSIWFVYLINGINIYLKTILFILSIIPISEIVSKIVNYIINKITCTKKLPKMNTTTNIERENSTFVVIPALVTSEKSVLKLLENIEKFYLANKADNLYFGILGDFKDCDYEINEEEEKILNVAIGRTKKLNEKYGDRFYYMHRKRLFNQHDKKWMGYERKRGALVEFVRMLRGERTSIATVEGDFSYVGDIKYIITLDADTQMHFGIAKALINTMLHPLNKPIVDKEKGIVVKGHALLQPRIDINLIDVNKSLFTKIFAGIGGIDPYSCAISDIYQDVFGEGIFTGKGIFDVETFYELLDKTIPDNTVLSHDLLEGSYLRAGLVSDIEFTDGYPSTYISNMKRLHRWTRGDWQLIGWLTGKIKNSINSISKWKMLDNLRRSILPIFNITLILLAFILPNEYALLCVGLVVVTLSIDFITQLVELVLSEDRFRSYKIQSSNISGLSANLLQLIITLCFLPYNAYMLVDAVIRSLYRMSISRKNMLQWVTAEQGEAKNKQGLIFSYSVMWINVLSGIVVGIFSFLSGLNFGFIIAFLWIIAPCIENLIDKPISDKKQELTEIDKDYFRYIARKTWRYYEELAVAEDNYLAPDNLQIEPPNGAAHRTSPTNIGMLLVAYLSAWDFGYVTTTRLLTKLRLILDTIDMLPKWNGHLYNWYNTKTLDILPPGYISTVDNGNYIGYVMTLKQGLLEINKKPLIDKKLLLGLLDTLNIANIEDSQINVQEIRGLLKQEVNNKNIANTLGKFIEKNKTSYNNVWVEKSLEMAHSIITEIDMVEKSDEINQLTNEIVEHLENIIASTNFSFLYDNSRGLFSIGYSVVDAKLTNSYYDLFASEARQTSLIAVAKGDVDSKHWFKTARNLTTYNKKAGLIAWTGTMFEYLMPLLIIKNIKGSLLDYSYKFALENQIDYVKGLNTPWGISESAFYAFDVSLNYQYKAFGVQQLGLKRGLNNDLVIAPYACVMAAMVDEKKAIENMKRLKEYGADGGYGFYEAIDFTRSRLNNDENFKVVKSYMVHHQGMSLLAIDNVVHENIMQRRFHLDPVIKASEYLLEERMPDNVVIKQTNRDTKTPNKQKCQREYTSCIRVYENPNLTLPKAHIISNGSYGVIINELGGGYSYCNDINVTRRRDDAMRQTNGSFIYIADVQTKHWWTATYSPFDKPIEQYKVIFSHDKAEFQLKNDLIDCYTQITVSPEDNVEIRQVCINNSSDEERIIDVASYQEITLINHASDASHPAFSNLFVSTQYDEKHHALIAKRRPRNHKDTPVWAMNTMLVEGEMVGSISYETDRSKFIGRNRDVNSPTAIALDTPLTNTVGAVIDPVFAIRIRVKVPVGGGVKISFMTGVAKTREEIDSLVAKYSNLSVVSNVFGHIATRADMQMKYLLMTKEEEKECLELLSHLLHNSPSKERYSDIMAENTLGQANLWAFGISGDLPIIMASIANLEDISVLKSVLKYHEYLRLKGFLCDLVIISETNEGYRQSIYEAVNDAIMSSHARNHINKYGGVFIIPYKNMSHSEYILFIKVAAVVISLSASTITDSLTYWQRNYDDTINYDVNTNIQNLLFDTAGLDFFNDFGGFDKETGEYVIKLSKDISTPVPWSNVIANSSFGTIITETGGGYTWNFNSRENKLTRWSNDFVSDTQSETLYLRNNKTGYVFTITSQPIKEQSDYIVRYGYGYGEYTHQSDDMLLSQTVFVLKDKPAKIILITIDNTSEEEKDISLVYYIKPVLGSDTLMAKHLVAEYETVLFLENNYNRDFDKMVAFLDCSNENKVITADNAEFKIDANKVPYALKKGSLSGKTGSGFDVCAAMQTSIIIPANTKKQAFFVLGQTTTKDEAKELVNELNIDNINNELEKVKQYWKNVLSAVRVSTPNVAMNYLLNGWVLYQTIACRMFARSGFYQCGGAYGYRDQLQDALALIHTMPNVTRNQIIRHAEHQFLEGDVQHWWHEVQNSEQADRGIRTKFSDDLLWLAYVSCEYIETTGDYSILEEQASYLEGELLDEETDEKYFIPKASNVTENIYEHCIRAIDRGLRVGEHGLALIGSGDWNDGMNTVGNKGKGESVWLSWFICYILGKFIPIAYRKNDYKRADEYTNLRQQLINAIEENAWDGNWYRRAYFDDGTPIGSVSSAECNIDSIAQSWAIISGVGEYNRSIEAMQSLEKYLIDKDNGIIKLLTPSFENSEPSPGYIQSYIAGVRENGGQYTHAAVWVAMAFAKLGMGDKAMECFDMINPINHSRTRNETLKYKTEPYAIVADIYSNPQHIGRGGWSWYTGAAGWYYRVCIENILGVKRNADKLFFSPSIPRQWNEYSVDYRYNETMYKITFRNPQGLNTGVKEVYVDEKLNEKAYVSLVNDKKQHSIEVIMG